MAIYLRKGSSDPHHVWFYGGVFGAGRSNDAVTSWIKFSVSAYAGENNARGVIRLGHNLKCIHWGHRQTCQNLVTSDLGYYRLVCGRRTADSDPNTQLSGKFTATHIFSAAKRLIIFGGFMATLKNSASRLKFGGLGVYAEVPLRVYG